MKIAKRYLNLENGLNREWIITNGLGGFASSTIIGANTRKYHGLLIAAINPPGKRTLILSKVDESIEIDNKEYGIYTNIGKDYISKGFEYLESFEKNMLPEFIYKVKDVTINKKLSMRHDENTIAILYTVKNDTNKDIIFKMTPLLNYRDFHSINNNDINLKQSFVFDNKVNEISLDGNEIYINVDKTKYTKFENVKFNNMFYIEEEKRGFYPYENQIIPGVYEMVVHANETKEISFICSTESNIKKHSAKTIIKNEELRLRNIIKKSELLKEKKNPTKFYLDKQKSIESLIIAADSFVTCRPRFKTHTIMAGYHWFADWGRDAFIAYEGILLKLKRYDLAREVLLNFVNYEKDGIIPNSFDETSDTPLYNSADASLLLFEQVNKYVEYTNDYVFIKDNIYKTLENIIKHYTDGTNLDGNNIYLDNDCLISSGSEEIQNTWMDAKIGDKIITPRNGKTVEINALWYNALKTMEKLSQNFNDGKGLKYKKLADKCKKSFEEKFYNETKKSLDDVIGDNKVRPNQLFSLSCTYPVLDPDSQIAEEIFNTVTKKLLNKYGLKTLAKGEEGYSEIYEGNPVERDSIYHQGITWTWLLGLYTEAFKKIVKSQKTKSEKQKSEKEYNKFLESIQTNFNTIIFSKGMIGSISELHDSKTPFSPKGAMSQAWTVSEILKIMLEN